MAGESPPSRLVKAALEQTRQNVRYDGRYFVMGYPGGDVPAHLGVCTDVVIRGYRALGIDLQKLVHEDMKAHFGLYPKNWGLKRPDTNIDHRRVPNLQVFFKRFGKALPVSQDPVVYRSGDLVTWNLRRDGGDLSHIGIVTDRRSAEGKRPLIVHNIGPGPRLEDMLFDYKITGHYRYGLSAAP
ncbi:MAG: DUF1287 domain-containing protein [Pseudomonadota bacterium]|nr:DUF1287 domain-containing protein [Pseudomonadota bacterium]